MRKLLLILFGLLLAVFVSGQATRVYNQNIQINKVVPILDLQGLGAKIYLDGATSGTATLQPPAVAGATVHTLPSATGTLTNFGDTTSTLATQWKARDITHDTIQNERDNAVLGLSYEDYEGGSTGNDYYMTPDQIKSYVGAGGGGAFTGDILKFIIGTTTGAPSAGDSTIIHSAFQDKQVDVFRRGNLHWFHAGSVNTRDSSYRINEDTIFVRPDWTDDEWVEIRIREPISWSYLALEGQESDLVDSLVVFYSADEASGSNVSNVVNPGTTDATMWTNYTSGASGKYSYGKHIGYMGSMTITAGSLASPRGADFSVSMWFRLDADSVPNVLGRDAAGAPAPVNNNVYLWSQKHTATMPDGTYYSHRLYIDGSTADSNKVIFTTYNNDVTPTQYTVESSVKIHSNRWYCVTAVNPGNGSALKLYINGADVSASAGTFTGTVFRGLSTTYFGNVNYAYEYSFPGYLDEMGIWKEGLSAAEALEFYEAGKTYPWE